MRVLDPGHHYRVDIYDGTSDKHEILFMKREGKGYPYNVGKHAGTNCQELLRVLIDRVKYLDKQIPCNENKDILHSLRLALFNFEFRAAVRHGRKSITSTYKIEELPHCIKCGHINCEHMTLP